MHMNYESYDTTTGRGLIITIHLATFGAFGGDIGSAADVIVGGDVLAAIGRRFCGVFCGVFAALWQRLRGCDFR